MQRMIFYKINIKPDSQSRRLWHRGNSQRSTHLISTSPTTTSFFFILSLFLDLMRTAVMTAALNVNDGGGACSEVLPSGGRLRGLEQLRDEDP